MRVGFLLFCLSVVLENERGADDIHHNGDGIHRRSNIDADVDIAHIVGNVLGEKLLGGFGNNAEHTRHNHQIGVEAGQAVNGFVEVDVALLVHHTLEKDAAVNCYATHHGQHDILAVRTRIQVQKFERAEEQDNAKDEKCACFLGADRRASCAECSACLANNKNDDNKGERERNENYGSRQKNQQKNSDD